MVARNLTEMRLLDALRAMLVLVAGHRRALHFAQGAVARLGQGRPGVLPGGPAVLLLWACL